MIQEGAKKVLNDDEDEKIRKTLIDYFNRHKAGINIFYGIKGEDILAWLEKQGTPAKSKYIEKQSKKPQRMVSAEAKEALYGMKTPLDKAVEEEVNAWLEKQGKCETDCPQNHQDVNHPNGCITMEDFNGGEGFYKLNIEYLNKRQVEEIEEMIRTWNKDSKVHNENIKSCIGMCLTDVCEQRFKDYNTSLKDCLAWLEKQGEQKPVISGDALREGIAHFGITQYQIDNWLKKYVDVERQGEQKSSDKAEPKFKVGDWIANDYCAGKVIALTDDAYLLDTEQGIPFSYEHNAHPWTIQDAKDGDVLAGKIDGDDYILIFKQIKDGWVETYGHYYDAVDRFCAPSQLFCRDYKGTLHPATKEQRDILFQKMHEAGYEWDAEKKELSHQEMIKKSEQDKEIDTYSLLFHKDDRNYEAIKLIRSAITNCPHMEEEDRKKVKDWLKSVQKKLS